ncbi:hypothetical protein ILUMI_08678 [Ignelater luminosus]|uniref:THAP-type domain-containing protein n=1 Tax=Ignelater luminosus TaxID=2038154 RepID=A0A8K0GFQ9_IGNLU|nr:hypothetical protein ILUMI_08678 [Ignelater luminosus]
MPKNCLVVKCNSNSARHRDRSFYRIPSPYGPDRKINKTSQERRRLWIDSLNRSDMNDSKLKYGRICSLHFQTGEPASLIDKYHPDWIPSINMGCTERRHSEALKRYKCSKDRAQSTTETLDEKEDFEEMQDEELKIDIVKDEKLKVEEIKVEEIEIEELKIEELYNEELEVKEEEELQAKDHTEQIIPEPANLKVFLQQIQEEKYNIDVNYLKSNKDCFLYYTGFPDFVYVHKIFQMVENYLPQNVVLTKYQQLLLTLVRLRLNLQLTDLSCRFNVDRTTATCTFERVINVLYSRLKSLVAWPMRKDLQRNIPQCFKEAFGNKATVIIDCFELFIEKASNLENSNCKHHYTVKFLIGISPQGSIIFISNAYAGGASDKFIVEDSGILNKLCRGDVIIADEGFSIDNSIKSYCAEVKYPSFVKDKKQLSAVDSETTRKLADVRIHVQRVIGVLRSKFRILKETFPTVALIESSNETVHINKIIVVCAALFNLCPGIIPLE